MRRLANGTQVASLPAPSAAVGTPGYGTNGDPAAGIQPSIFDAGAYNPLQEEIVRVIEAAGLTPDANNLAQLLAAIRALTPNRINPVLITVSGNYVPSPKLIYAQVEGVGGGGGGGAAAGGSSGSAGAGGGAGGYGRLFLTRAEIGTFLSMQIGAAGAGGASGSSAGTAGGSTIISGVATFNGGAGGGGAGDGGIGTGGVGGNAGGAALVIPGENGKSGTIQGTTGFSGAGGSTAFGFGGPQASISSPAGAPGVGFGTGGSGGGASTNLRAGGAGRQGAVLVTEFLGV